MEGRKYRTNIRFGLYFFLVSWYTMYSAAKRKSSRTKYVISIKVPIDGFKEGSQFQAFLGTGPGRIVIYGYRKELLSKLELA